VTAFSSVVGYRLFGETCCHASHLRKPYQRRETGGPLEKSRCSRHSMYRAAYHFLFAVMWLIDSALNRVWIISFRPSPFRPT